MNTTLDIFNYLKKESPKMTKDESIMVLAINKKNGFSMTNAKGKISDIASIFDTSNTDDLDEEKERENEIIQEAIIKIAVVICKNNQRLRINLMKILIKMTKERNKYLESQSE